jgi:type I restriction-modification system DNA methylase subunit
MDSLTRGYRSRSAADEQFVLITLTNPPPLDADITITLKAGARSKPDYLGSLEPAVYTFHTLRPFNFSDVTARSSSSPRTSQYETIPINVYFNYGVAEGQGAERFFSIDGLPALTKDNITIYGSTVVLNGLKIDYEKNYTLVIKSGLKDILGRTYEYCLKNFAEQEGKLAGEFYTPASVVRTLMAVLQPFEGRVYDPCCGSGGMFVQSAKFVAEHQGRIHDISVYGQDANPTTWKMAQMNLAIRGIEADLGGFAADTFFNDLHPTLRADFILANPPFNLSNWGADKLKDDVRWKFGLPPAGNANFAWMQHMIHHLAPKGRMGLVLANGSLSSQSGGEGEIRKRIVEADLVAAVVAMPP